MEIKNDVKMEDFIEFFGKTKEELLNTFPGRELMLQAIFKNSDKMNKYEIYELYRNTDYHLIWTREIGASYFTTILESPLNWFGFDFFLKKFPDRDCKILNWGCGHGEESLRLAFLGYDVTLADVPHLNFLFLEFLSKKYLEPMGIKIKFFRIPPEEFALTEIYDSIICMDVLEHVTEVEPLLDHLVAHLKDLGWMYLTTFFDDVGGKDPSHLKRNVIKYNHTETFLGVLIRKRLIPMVRSSDGVEKIYQKRKGTLEEIL